MIDNELFSAGLLGLVQGLTEFLPVSSTGHLILTSSLLGLHGEAIKTFEVFIQLGSILAVLVLYRQRFIRLLVPGRAAGSGVSSGAGNTPKEALVNRQFAGLYGLWLLFLTCLPASLLGLFAHSLIKTYLFNPLTVALALAVGAVLMLLLERYKAPRQPDDSALPTGPTQVTGPAQATCPQDDSTRLTGSARTTNDVQTTDHPLTTGSGQTTGKVLITSLITDPTQTTGKVLITSLDQFTPKLALGIGLCQCLSLWPGFSRSASTIMGGLWLGADRKAAAEYSFIAAVPIMFAATGFDLLQNWESIGGEHLAFFAVGFLVSFLAALAAIKIFIGLVGRIGLAPFAWYRLALAPLVYWFFW